MAEAIVAVGLLGTAVQLAEVVIKAGKGNRDIVKGRSEILETCTHIQNLVTALEYILPGIKEDIETATIPDEHKLRLMQLMSDCSTISDSIREIIEQGTNKADIKAWRRYVRAYRLLSEDARLQRLTDHLSRCLNALQSFHNVYHMKLQTVTTKHLLELLQRQRDSHMASDNMPVVVLSPQVASSPAVVPLPLVEQQAVEGAPYVITSSQTDTTPTIERRHRDLRRIPINVIVQKCTCTRSSLSYAWPRSLRLTGWIAHESSCPSKCQQTGVSIWLASVFFGTAIKLDLDLTISFYQSLSLRCNLTPISIVPYVSPGFILAEKLLHPPWDWQNQRNTIMTMLETGAMTFDEVDPSGRGWLERVFSVRWWLALDQGFQLNLLRFIIDHATALDHSRLLSMCLSGYTGQQMSAVKVLIDIGVDFYSIEDTALSSWPRSLSSWPRSLSSRQRLSYIERQGRFKDDPFFIQVLAMVNDRYPGFGNNSRIQVAIMTGSMPNTKNELLKAFSASAVNFLGQTILHLAILYPHILAYLLEDPQIERMLNVGDNEGATPLMYAAAYGQIDSGVLLLKFGANPWHLNKLNLQTFIHYALIWANSQFLEEVSDYYLEQMKAQGRQEDGERLSVSAIWIHLLRHNYGFIYHSKYSLENVRQLLGNVSNPYEEVRDDQLFLHAVSCADDCRLLLELNGWSLNMTDQHGTTAFMNVASVGDPWSIRRCLILNADVNLRDHKNRSALSRFARSAQVRQSFLGANFKSRQCFDDVACSLYLLLQASDWPEVGDKCKCACSTHGCTWFTFLLNHRPFDNMWGISWEDVHHHMAALFEVISILEELQLFEALLSCLQQFQRFELFQTHEISHVCCASMLGETESFDEEEIAEILDEEDELVTQLTEDVERLPVLRTDTCHQDWVANTVRYFITRENQVEVADMGREVCKFEVSRPEKKDDPDVERIQVGQGYFIVDRARDMIYWPDDEYISEPLHVKFEEILDRRVAQINYSWSRNDSSYEEVGIKRPDSWRESRLKMVEELRIEYTRQKAEIAVTSS